MMKFEKNRFLKWPGWCVAFGLALTVLGRDPFYPIGYNPSAEPLKTNESEPRFVCIVTTNSATEAEWNVVSKPLQVTGSMITANKQVVYINRKPYPAGEQIRLTTTTKSAGLSSCMTTNDFIFEVTFSAAGKPLLKHVQHVRSAPTYLSDGEPRRD